MGALSVGGKQSFNLTQDIVNLVVARQRPQLQKSGSVSLADEKREAVCLFQKAMFDLTPSALTL